MTDVDELLRADAQRWNRELPAAPDLDAAVGALTAARDRHRFGRGRIAGTVGAALAVAATVIAAVLISNHRSGGSAPDQPAHGIKVPKSIVVDGESVPYAGGVPWAGAVVASPASTSVTVSADGDAIVTKKFVCGVPQERVHVRESSTTVTVLVAGYLAPLPAHYACDDVGHQPQVQRFTLSRPLGSRRLIDDAKGNAHRALIASTVPAPKVPSGYTENPLEWDDKNGVATRVYQEPGTTHTIALDYGTAAAVPAPGGGFTRLEKVRIAAATATVWRLRDANDDITIVTWSRGRHRLALTVQGDPNQHQHLSVAAAIAVARSVS